MAGVPWLLVHIPWMNQHSPPTSPTVWVTTANTTRWIDHWQYDTPNAYNCGYWTKWQRTVVYAYDITWPTIKGICSAIISSMHPQGRKCIVWHCLTHHISWSHLMSPKPLRTQDSWWSRRVVSQLALAFCICNTCRYKRAPHEVQTRNQKIDINQGLAPNGLQNHRWLGPSHCLVKEQEPTGSWAAPAIDR